MVEIRNFYIDLVEKYDGTSWSEVSEINTARKLLGGAGTSTAALAYAGRKSPSDTNVTDTESGMDQVGQK